MRLAEFFAGGGMVRAALGPEWRVVFANDNDPRKAEAYRRNWGCDAFHLGDIAEVDHASMPESDVAWASFPCQDLSLAGLGRGFSGKRSSTYWKFHRLTVQGPRPVPILVLENVCGLLTANRGADFASLCTALAEANYRFGAMIINAADFLPQSRPRLFLVAVRGDRGLPRSVVADAPISAWHTRAVQSAVAGLPVLARQHWVWWSLPPPIPSLTYRTLADTLLADDAVEWHPETKTLRLLEMMGPASRARATNLAKTGNVATVYLRTRLDQNGRKVQRAEVRSDSSAGCLRTPAGGSSRQIVLRGASGSLRTRLLAPREGARLMGLPEDYQLPESYYEAFRLLGDGVAVPAVRHVIQQLVEPLLDNETTIREHAA